MCVTLGDLVHPCMRDHKHCILLQAQQLESSLCIHCRTRIGGIGGLVQLAILLSGLTQPSQNKSILPLDIESTISILSSLLKLVA